MGLLGYMVQHFPKASTTCFISPNTFFLLILFPCLTSTIIAILLQYEKKLPITFSLQSTRSLLLLPLLFICIYVCVCVYICGGGGLVTKSCLTLVTPWTEEPGRLQSMGFSRQEYWSRLPFPSPGDLPDPGIELGYPAL